MSRTTRQRRQFVEKDGKPLLVVRPSDPELAIRLAQEAIENTRDPDKQTEAAVAFLNLPALAEAKGVTYTFVGYLGKRPAGTTCIVDKDLRVVGELVRGDSFITEKSVEKFKNPDATEWTSAARS